ncbi:DUF3363 domain-containing protein [Bradyrhizobium oligotrophicum]|uniref:DUF3363 domain-containing protein n=1 Tax=Bradyrhizobium oligotrophicum TaxID=44255 RepID=UPI001FCA79B1|nr:DUF3363 domain-containing protein [Bradyrhizobium oligotrophicum]
MDGRARGRAEDAGARRTRQHYWAFTVRREEWAVSDYSIEGFEATSPILGRFVDRGLHDELTDEADAVIDGVDGRAHHVPFRGVEAFAQASPAGGIVDVRRFGGWTRRGPPWCWQRLRPQPCRQAKGEGATWLDHRLVERSPCRSPTAASEPRRHVQRIVVQRDLLKTLRRRELRAVDAKVVGRAQSPTSTLCGGCAGRRGPTASGSCLPQVGLPDG